jgi:hypothetical protein
MEDILIIWLQDLCHQLTTFLSYFSQNVMPKEKHTLLVQFCENKVM